MHDNISFDLNGIFLLQPGSSSELALTWRRLADLQYAMSWPQSTIVQGAVYVREGAEYSGDIHRYDLRTQQWTKLPLCKYCWFTMTEVNQRLTVIGGLDVSTCPIKVTKEVAVYSISQGWTEPYPPMNTPCQWPAASAYNQHLVVAGGCDESWTDIATVEIIDTSTPNSQWLSTTPLPISCSCISSAIVNKELYLLGGSLSRRVLNVSLPALTQTGKTSTQWRITSDAPLEYSAAIAFRGSLLAVGGSHNKQDSSAIHIYHQEKDMWTKLGDLPTVREDCTCCLLLSGEIVVAGGRDCKGWTSRMDVAVVMD